MNNFRKYIASLSLVISLFAINGSEFFHHHEGETFHGPDECQACFFQKILNTAAIPVSGLSFVLVPVYQEYYLSNTNFSFVDLINCPHGRAPPIVSHI